jgi:hypothetical protein
LRSRVIAVLERLSCIAMPMLARNRYRTTRLGLHGPGQRVHDTLGRYFGPLVLVDAFQQHREFVPA